MLSNSFPWMLPQKFAVITATPSTGYTWKFPPTPEMGGEGGSVRNYSFTIRNSGAVTMIQESLLHCK